MAVDRIAAGLDHFTEHRYLLALQIGYRDIHFGLFQEAAAGLALRGAPAELDWFYVSPPLDFGAWVPAPDTGSYRLSEVPEALRYLGEGHAKGKVVITVQ